MYEAFFGLKEKPFSLLPDPSFLYLSRKHAAALSLLEYAVAGQAGFCVITGDVGSGKTTLIRQFLKLVGPHTTPGVIYQTHRDFGELFHWILSAYDIKCESDDKVTQHRALMDFLVTQHQQGRRAFLVIDEAQNLSIEALEELRLLSNINYERKPHVQFILAGQPELLEKLKRPELRQFAQRIAVHYHLHPLDFQETRLYVRHRIQVAGGKPELFDDWAIGAIYLATQGVPRLVNSMCDLGMVYAFADGKTKVDIDTILMVARDREQGGLTIFPRSLGRLGRERIIAETTSMMATLSAEKPVNGGSRNGAETAAAAPLSATSPIVVTAPAAPSTDAAPVSVVRPQPQPPKLAAVGGQGKQTL